MHSKTDEILEPLRVKFGHYPTFHRKKNSWNSISSALEQISFTPACLYMRPMFLDIPACSDLWLMYVPSEKKWPHGAVFFPKKVGMRSWQEMKIKNIHGELHHLQPSLDPTKVNCLFSDTPLGIFFKGRDGEDTTWDFQDCRCRGSLAMWQEVGAFRERLLMLQKVRWALVTVGSLSH